MKLKIEIKTIFGSVLFAHESEGNTIKETVKELLKKYKDQTIEKAYLSDMDLSEIDFSYSSFDNSSFDNSSFDNSRFDNSSFDNSSFYNSRFDNSSFDEKSIDSAVAANAFDTVKNDFWSILLKSQPEILGLKRALIEGRVDGSTYEGECACLVGTIANVRHANYKSLNGIKPNADRPAEKWFTAIRKEHTPENNVCAKLALIWIEEFESYVS